MRAVAVTGMGIVSGLGAGVSAHLAALRTPQSGLTPLTLFSLPGLPSVPVGQVAQEQLGPRRSPRSLALARMAAKEALAQAGLPTNSAGLLALGTTTGGIFESEELVLTHRGADLSQHQAALRHHAVGTLTDALAHELSLPGERHTFSTACSSSANAIGFGAARVAAGAPWALVGGVDSLSRLTYSGFHSLKLLSAEPCRPFDRHRQGLSLGEGAAFLVLESEGEARRRGAPILGYVAGWGCAADAHHPTSPHPEGDGALRAMQQALVDAAVTPGGVHYVNAHGTATPANDRAESLALRRLFGEQMPWVSSTKGATGHTLGAAGAMEALFSLLSLAHGFAPSTVGLEENDPELTVRHVPRGGVGGHFEVALSNSFGFGGNNTALVLRKGES